MASLPQTRQRSPTSTTTTLLVDPSHHTAPVSSSSSSNGKYTPRPPSGVPPAAVRAAVEKARHDKIVNMIIISIMLVAGIFAMIYMVWNATSLPTTKATSSAAKPATTAASTSPTAVTTARYAPLPDADTNAPWNAYHNGGALVDANSAWFAYSTPANDELLWQRYAAWHSAQLHYHATCATTTEFIVWSGNAVSYTQLRWMRKTRVAYQ